MSEIRYSLELKYSDEDGCYLGRCPEIAPFVNMGGAVAHGDTWEEAARETEVAVRNVLSYLIKNGTDIPLPLKYEATVPRATVAAALPESWYADSPPEFRIQKMVEQWQKLHKREKEVAAALAELREKIWKDARIENVAAHIVAREIDATIAALGLGGKEESK